MTYKKKRKQKRWTTSEHRLLVKLWHVVGETRLRKAIKHCWRGIKAKAVKLGLPQGIPQGCLSVRAASEKYGVSHGLLTKVAERYNVPIKRQYSLGRRHPRNRIYYVDWDDIKDALDQHFEVCSIAVLSEQLSIAHRILKKWLIAAGHTPPEKYRQWRLPLEVAKKVVEENRSRRAA